LTLAGVAAEVLAPDPRVVLPGLRALAGVAFRAVPLGEVGDGLGERDAICERLGPPEQTRCP